MLQAAFDTVVSTPEAGRIVATVAHAAASPRRGTTRARRDAPPAHPSNELARTEDDDGEAQLNLISQDLGGFTQKEMEEMRQEAHPFGISPPPAPPTPPATPARGGDGSTTNLLSTVLRRSSRNLNPTGAMSKTRPLHPAPGKLPAAPAAGTVRGGGSQ